MKKISGIFILGILSLLTSAAYSGYYYFDNDKKSNELEVIEKELNKYEKDELKAKNNEVLQAITAKTTANSLKADLIEWSKAIKDIRKTLPKDGGKVLVDVISYSGSLNKQININVKTLPDSENAYFDVAKVIEAFALSKEFDEVFVPSIAKGTDQDGKTILSFSLSANYIPENSVSTTELAR